MALCSMCGGFTDINITPITPVVPIIETDPYCSKCGKRKNTTCNSCGGRGYTMVPSLIPEYCSRCGRQIKKETRQTCFICHGSGKISHICTGF